MQGYLSRDLADRHGPNVLTIDGAERHAACFQCILTSSGSLTHNTAHIVDLGSCRIHVRLDRLASSVLPRPLPIIMTSVRACGSLTVPSIQKLRALALHLSLLSPPFQV